MLKKKRFWLGLVFTVVFLYFVLRGIDFKKLWEIIRDIDITLLTIAAAIYIFGYYIRAVRWHYLLKHIKRFKASALFPYLVMGFMFNNILPARMGEFIRAYLTGMKKGISKASVFATVIIERVFDGLVMIFYFILGYKAFNVISETTSKMLTLEGGVEMEVSIFKNWLGVFALAGSFIFVGVFVLSFFLIHKKAATINFLHFFVKKFPAKFGEIFNRIIDMFIEGLGVLRYKRELFTAFFYSAAAWTVEVFTYWLMAQAMGIEVNFYLVCLIMAVANFAIMAPSTSGGIGPFEFFGVGVMLLFAYEKETAVAYIFVIHAMILLPIIALGLIFFIKEGFDMRKIIKSKEVEENA